LEVAVISDDIFAQMVAEEVKNKLAPSQRNTLLQQENWDRWRRALLALVENLNGQIESLEADAESDASRYEALGRDGKRLAETAAAAYSSRMNKITRFKFYVENRLNQVESMIEGGSAMEGNDVEFYRKAIRTHRELLEEYDMEATTIDQALWAVLDQRWEFDSITAP